MARRRQKRRTHVPDVARQNPAPQHAVNSKTPVHASMARTPKTMVIRAGAGQVGPSVTALTGDVRRVMEPFTASRLQVSSISQLFLSFFVPIALDVPYIKNPVKRRIK